MDEGDFSKATTVFPKALAHLFEGKVTLEQIKQKKKEFDEMRKKDQANEVQKNRIFEGREIK